MSDESIDKEGLKNENTPSSENQHSDYKPADTKDGLVKHQLTGMYQNWFLDYTMAMMGFPIISLFMPLATHKARAPAMRRPCVLNELRN